MDPEIKAKWIAALRSGRYPQTRAALRTDVGYCCLGVLCDLLRPKGWRIPIAGQPLYMHSGNYSSLGGDLAEESDLSSERLEWLIHMNDTGKSFAAIADYIDRNF